MIYGFVNFFLSLLPAPIVSYFLLWDKDCIYYACTWNYNKFYVSLIDRWILFLTLVFYIEVSDLYAIIAKDIFIFVLTYTPLIRDLFISQIFTKKLHVWLWLIGTGIGTINKKTVENNYQNNSETQGKDHSKNKSTIEISKSVTEKSQTNLIGSIISTTEKNPQKKNCVTHERN